MNQLFYSVAAFALGIVIMIPFVASSDTRLQGQNLTLQGENQILLGSLQREQQAKQVLMKDHIWLNERLKQTPTIDLSLGTAEEWQSAAIAAANERSVSAQDIVNAGSINAALRSKAGQLSVLCSNPNSTVIRPIKKVEDRFTKP